MQAIIKKLDKAETFTKELFEEIDNAYSFGIIAKTKKSKKIIYETKKNIYIVVNILTDKREYKGKPTIRYEFVEIKSNITVSPRNDKICVLMNEETGECYYEKNGKSITSHRNELDPDVTMFQVSTGTKPIDEEYQEMQKCIEQIKKEFNMDEQKYDLRYLTWISRNLAYDQTFKYLHNTKGILKDEYEFLNGSVKGQLIYAQKGKVITNAYGYDVNLFYTSMLNNCDFFFPMDKGTKEYYKSSNLQEQEGNLYIYKLKIKSEHKYFERTLDDFYNTYYIHLLKILNIDFEYDESFGRMSYHNPLKSPNLFSYLLKTAKMRKENALAKIINNTTWGGLSRESVFEKKFEDYNPKLHSHLVERFDSKYRMFILKSSEDDEIYKFHTGRLKSFILAYARLYVVRDILLPLEEQGYKVYRVNTDGFMTNCNPDEMNEIYEIGEHMGFLKNDKTYKGKYKINHVNDIEKIE